MVFVPLMIIGVVGLVVLVRPWPLFMHDESTRAPNEQAVERNFAWGFAKWVEHQARARGLNVRGIARPVPLECRKCRKASNYFVYPDDVCACCWRASLKPRITPVNDNSL
jgi:hypothetical protein